MIVSCPVKFFHLTRCLWMSSNQKQFFTSISGIFSASAACLLGFKRLQIREFKRSGACRENSKDLKECGDNKIKKIADVKVLKMANIRIQKNCICENLKD